MNEMRELFLEKVEHTLLTPWADQRTVESFIEDALRLGVGGVCLTPCWIRTARRHLSNRVPRLVSVVGFPAGTSSTSTKVMESRTCVEDGADELDVVMALGLLRSGLVTAVRGEIERVVRAVAPIPVKVIIETGVLTQKEKWEAARVCRDGGAAFVKTSTGFAPGGAAPEDVRLLIEASGLAVKASGGIRTLEQVRALLAAGAQRLGMSRTAEVLGEIDAARE